ncbi:helix-turn-helix transcriptional regulator [Aeromonas hydrophila]|uniref:helix-turn-helix transcriptional regulator n=1 Tax=Aeromonas hydrophila TaxID=644 RepID=UPI0039892259
MFIVTILIQEEVLMQCRIKVLRCSELTRMLGISRSSLYDRLSTSSPRFDPCFPKPVRLGKNSIGWLEHEVEEWLLGTRTH